MQTRWKSNHWLATVCFPVHFSKAFLRHNILFSYIFHSLREGLTVTCLGTLTDVHTGPLQDTIGRGGGLLWRFFSSPWVPSVGCLQRLVSMASRYRSDQISYAGPTGVNAYIPQCVLGGISCERLILFSSDEGGRNEDGEWTDGMRGGPRHVSAM